MAELCVRCIHMRRRSKEEYIAKHLFNINSVDEEQCMVGGPLLGANEDYMTEASHT